MKNQELIYRFVDDALQSLEELDMMRLPIEDIPKEMLDTSGKQVDDWKPWKPIPSTVSDEEIHEIEMLTKIPFPESFKLFLKYKHFYELDSPQPQEVVFFRHPIHTWKESYVSYYSYDWVRENLINKGFIPFADHQDWGIICFDSNRKSDSKDYPVVMIDHELVYEVPLAYEEFGDSFLDLIRNRLSFN